MHAVILAAGEGVRMHPLTHSRPKVMIPLANKPILEHLLISLRGAGIDDFIFIVGHCAETIRNYFGNGQAWNVRTSYVTQEKQLGSANALEIARDHVKGRFVVANGDVISTQEDISKIVLSHDTAMSLAEVEDPQAFGIAETQGNRVLRIHEKVYNPPTNLANAGVYIFDTSIFKAIDKTKRSSRDEYEITDSLQMLIDNGHPVVYETFNSWLHVSHPWDLLVANKALLDRMEPYNLGTIEEHVVLKGLVQIGKNTVIRSNSYIVGPVAIGDDCDIGPNCYIRPATSIGNKCHIGAAVEVKNSIIMNGSKIPHHNYVGDSIIGEKCNLGAGTKIANLRFDGKDIAMGDNDTGTRKLGVIMGDSVQTGINASINPGTAIGSGTLIGPGAIASGMILPNSRIS